MKMPVIQERVDVKYIILTYGAQKDYDAMSGHSAQTPALKPEDFAPMHEFMRAFSRDLVTSGELVDTRGLDAPVHTRRVRLQNGAPVVTDGPYAETQEVLAGYWIVVSASKSGPPGPVRRRRVLGTLQNSTVFAVAERRLHACRRRPVVAT
ncbi:MAG: hypothetical protein ABI211_23965 [Vicinamibacterales bacterium]